MDRWPPHIPIITQYSLRFSGVTPKRAYGTGSISWVGPTKVLLRVYAEDGRRSKVVNVASKNHGGRGEAADALADFIEEVNRPVVKGPQRTLTQTLEAFIDHCRTRRAQGTVESYEAAAKRVPKALGGMRLTDVGTKDLDALYDTLGATLADNTVRQTHAFLSSAFTQAMKWEWITVNPAANAGPPTKVRPKRVPLLPSQINQMIALALKPPEGQTDGDIVLAMAVLLAALTGCRRGELCGLRWDDLDPETNSLRVERQWVPGKGGQYLKPPKNGDERTVEFDVLGMALLEGYRSALGERLNREPEGWLLSHDAGTTPMRAKSLGAAISDLGDRLGHKITPHSFRRVSATELMAAGVDVDTAARRLGHTTEVMLASYVLGSKDRQVAAAAALEERLVDQGLNLSDVFAIR